MKTATKALLLAAWLACMYWLVRYEAFPETFAREVRGYRALLRDRAEVSDTWMKITFGGRDIGYSHGSTEINETSSDPELIMDNTTQIQISLLGAPQRLKIGSRLVLTGAGKLKSFELSAFGAGQSARATGTRAQGETYNVSLDFGGKITATTLTIPDDTVLFSPYLEFSLGGMSPGEQRVLNVFDPLSMSRKKVRFAAEARERIFFKAREVPVTRIAVAVDEMRMHSWIDADGRVLRQTTPFGWTLEACDATEALATFSHPEPAGNTLPVLPGLPPGLAPSSP